MRAGTNNDSVVSIMTFWTDSNRLAGIDGMGR